METIKLTASKLNSVELTTLAEVVGVKLAPPLPATPPVPNMGAKVISLNTVKTSVVTANSAYVAGLATLAALKVARDATVDALRKELNSVAAAVVSEAKGNAVMLAASGFTLASAPVQTTQPPGQVLNLAVTGGDDEGELDLTCDPVGGARSYEVETSLLAPPAAVWTKVHQGTTSKASLSGLTSGQRLWIRMRAIGVKGAGAWSDVATKTVP